MTLFDLLVAVTPTPTPSGEPFNEDTVTPGWVGFIAVFLIAVATVFLILDMTKRIRRVRYRAEVVERLDAEESGR